MPDKNLVEIMADAYKLAPSEFVKTIKTACFPRGQATDEQLYLFLSVAREHELNPFTREIYAFVSEKTGQMQSIVGVDGWAKIINRHPAFDGMEFEDQAAPGPSGKVIAITCRIYRKDRSHPIPATEYMVECKRQTIPWQQWERRMLRHKAMIQAARLAFGLAGIIDPDELERYYDVEIKAQRVAEGITLSLDAPVTQNELDESKRQFPDELKGQSAGRTEPAQSGAADRPSGGAAQAPAPRRGRPPTKNQEPQCTCFPKPRFDLPEGHQRACPKYQEPQAPHKAAEVTPLSPVVAATVSISPDPQPESRGSCPFCHMGNHSFNDCPENRAPDERGDADNDGRPVTTSPTPDNTVAAPAPTRAAANGRTLNDEEQAEIERMSRLLRPKNHLSWMLRQLEPFGVEDVSDLPADRMQALIKRMQENA